MNAKVREALDTLIAEVDSAKGNAALCLIEAQFLSHDELLVEAKATIEELRRDMREANLELARAQEFAV